LDSTSKPNDAIKTETLLAGLGPEYESTLAALDVSGTTSFEDIVSKFRKAETRIKGIALPNQNLARFTTKGKQGFSKKRPRKGVCYHYGKPGHHKRECKKLLAEQAIDRRDDSDTRSTRRGGADPQKVYGNRYTDAPANHRQAEPQEESKAWAISHQAQKVAVNSKVGQLDPWYLDSAATSHMTNCKSLFIDFRQVRDTVTIADGRQLPSQGLGKVKVQFEGKDVQIHNVLYVPGLQGNLLSVGQLAERDIDCIFSL